MCDQPDCAHVEAKEPPSINTIIRHVLERRVGVEFAKQVVQEIERTSDDIDTCPISIDSKTRFKIGADEFPIIEQMLKGLQDAEDIMKEIKTRVRGAMAQDALIASTKVQGPAVVALEELASVAGRGV